MTDTALIHTLFDAAAARRPDALAISSDSGTLTYAELDRRSAALAARIATSGAGRGEVVAIHAGRGPAIIVAALGCARAGRPFVIFDPAYPAARLEALVAVARPKLLLTGADAEWAGPDLATLAIGGLVEAADPVLPTDITPDEPAYLLFTSGSTGAPKCVACSHRPLVNFVDWQARTFDLTQDDRFTLLSGLSHDPILRDIFTPLSLGASIHIPTQATLTEPGGLIAWFARSRPTAAHMTPPLGHLLTAGRGPHQRLEDLRYVFWGGDVLLRGVVDAVSAIAPACESVNFYGSTETPQAASFFRVPAGWSDERAPIGVGIDGFSLDVRDEDGRVAADGIPGEIVVRSDYLTLGYVAGGRLPVGPGAPSYPTGDVGYRRSDGKVVIQGRRDDQVKIRGYRVELAEITASALKAPGVGQAITLNVGAADAARLCCFVETTDRRCDAAAVRAHIAAALPGYMVPDEVEALERLPLLPNGKVDRQALIAAQVARQAPPARAASSLGKVEAGLIESWSGIIRRGAITPASSFASLGGDSLSYVAAYLSLEEALGHVPDNWTTMTIAELAALAEPAAKRGAFVEIESAILLRAVAIAAVVGSHFQLFFSGGGGTSALLWVSGCIFGNLQLREMAHGGDLKPIGRLLKSILLPLYLLELPQFLAKLALHGHARLSSVLLYTDLLDYSGMPSSGPDAYGGHEYLLWYIHAVVHIVIAYAALLAFCKYVLKLRRPVMVAALSAVGLGFLGRFLLPALLQPGFWTTPVDPMSYFNHAPTTHLATFALAALSGYLAGRWRWVILAVTAAYVALSMPIYGWADSLPIALVAGLLVVAPKLRVPRILSTPIYMTAGASFFIYLLQFKFLVFAGHLHLPNLAAWPLAIAGGVAVWSAWNGISRRAGGVWSALRQGRLLPAKLMSSPARA